MAEVTTNSVFTTSHIWDVHDLNMQMQKFGWPDYLVFIFMLIICIIIGIYFGFFQTAKTEAEYLVGGRSMKIFPVGLSLIASYISGISLLGIPTEIYVYGIQYMYILIGVVLMAIAFQTLYLPVFMDLKLTSSFEYLERRFSWTVRIFGSVLCIIGTSTWLPVVIYVPALAFNQVTGINVHLITPVVCLICIFYTSLGGLKAVVWTDVIQTVVMVGTMIFIAVKGTLDVGGFLEVIGKNVNSTRIEPPVLNFSPFERHTFWSVVIGGSGYFLNSSAVNQPMLQRYLSLPSMKAAKKALWIFVVGIFVLIITNSYCGMLIYATYADCDPITTKLAKQKDQLLPVLVMDVLGDYPGIPGLFVAGIFSAALSSLSTGLNSLVAIILEDFYRPFFSKELSEKHKQIMMKTTTVILGVIFVALVFVVEHLGTVLQLTMSIGTISAGPALALFTMGMMIPWINTKGALIGSSTGLIFMAWLILSAQAAISNGDITFATKPVSTSGCNYTFASKISKDSVNHRDLFAKTETQYGYDSNSDVPIIYQLSYLWYTLLGMLLSCLVGFIATLTGIGGGCLDPNDIDPSLLTPVVRNHIRPRQFPNQPVQDQIILAYDAKSYEISTISSKENDLPTYKNNTSEL